MEKECLTHIDCHSVPISKSQATKCISRAENFAPTALLLLLDTTTDKCYTTNYYYYYYSIVFGFGSVTVQKK